LLVHIGDPSSNQATTLESQMIHMIQVLSGQTLRDGAKNVRDGISQIRSERKASGFVV
jgi:hypothetical protein